MERDKRGRFVKKALGGTLLNSDGIITSEGKRYKLKPNLQMSLILQLLERNKNNIDVYNHYLTQYFDPVEETSSAGVVTPSTTLETPKDETTAAVIPATTSVLSSLTGGINTGIKYKKLNTGLSTSLNTPGSKLYSTKAMMSTIPTSLNFNFGDVNARKKALEASAMFGLQDSMLAPEKIKYTIKDGKFIDEFGNNISSNDIAKENSIYTRDFQANEGTGVTTETKVRSKGMNLFPKSTKNKTQKNFGSTVNKERLANFLELARAGIGASVNNKIAERALEAEKPFLQDVSESHRAVYGDYRSQLQGEKAAALLRNMASKPLTSDGALQQQMMMDAQIKGLLYIDQGNAQDEALIKQTRETAWLQEKENQQQRLAAAMQNRQAMLMSQKNKAQIENARDSANFSQVLSPLLSGAEQRLRNKSKEQEYYQNLYEKARISSDVWNTHTTGLSPEQKEMVKIFNTSGVSGIQTYVNGDKNKEAAWLSLNNIMQNEILRRQAALKGVYINPFSYSGSANPYAMWDEGLQFDKKGGIIYKARLTKRTKDNDRTVKSIESSKKIAARFLEKAIDSLYAYNDVELIAKPKNKRKYLAGGGLPFVGFSPVFATSETGTHVEQVSKNSSNENLTNKDILQLLKDMDGLPADMLVIIDLLLNFLIYDVANSLSSSSNVSSRYISLIGKIKMAQFNKNEYNNAFNQLKSNGGLNEYAVTSEGLLIGSNKEGDFEYFTPEQVNSGEPRKNGYALLTNSNLLYLRANSSEAAFNHLLTTVAQNGIGMEVITKLVNDILQALGKSKEGEEGMILMGAKELVKNGIKFLLKASKAVGDDGLTENMSIADYYQAGYMTEDQAQLAQLALLYIWSALPANAKSLLLVKGGGAAGAEAIIQSLVYSKTSTDTSFKANSKKMAKTGSSGGSGDSNVDGLKLSPVQMMLVGYTDHEKVTLQKGTKYAMTVNALVLPITDVNKKLLGITTLDKVAESTFGGALDMNNVTMGSLLIDPQALQNVLVDSTNLYVMNLPIDKSFSDGTIKPDLSWMTKIEEIDKIIREKHITDIDEINKLYVNAGLPVLMNDNGELNIQDYCKFGVLNGHALNSAFKNLDALDNSVIEVTDENDITNILNIINKGRGKEERVGFDEKSWWDSIFNTDHDSMYEGTIYIPIRTNPFTGMIGGGQYPETEMAEEVEALIQQKERTRGYVDPGLLI